MQDRPGARDGHSSLAEAVHAVMPELKSELVYLTRIPSIAFPGFPPEPLFAAHDYLVGLLREAGVEQINDLVVPGKTAPVIVAEVPGPSGSPTVLLYTHYDVVPPGDEALWDSPPFEPEEREGAIYGRGTADSKANLMSIIGALKVYDCKPPVTLKIVFEGQEELGSPFDNYPPTMPELFRADAMVIADVGSVRPGVPTLTVALRGSAAVTVEARTMAGDKHSGQYGGAAPDARIALVHALAALHDANGDVAVPGLRRESWTGAGYTDEEFRSLAEIEPGIPFMGTGGLGERIWSGPAITITGFDAPSVENQVNAVSSYARAGLNLRVHPEQDAGEAQAALVRYLEAMQPFGVPLTVTAGEAGNGFAAGTSGRAYAAAASALATAWGGQAVSRASGGSIPLVMALHQAVPAAELLLFGATDGYSNIHAPNERVRLDEFERAVLAKASFFREYAERARAA